MVHCLTSFADPYLSITDGRDLYNELVGELGWKQNYPLHKLIWLLPELVEDLN